MFTIVALVAGVCLGIAIGRDPSTTPRHQRLPITVEVVICSGPDGLDVHQLQPAKTVLCEDGTYKVFVRVPSEPN